MGNFCVGQRAHAMRPYFLLVIPRGLNLNPRLQSSLVPMQFILGRLRESRLLIMVNLRGGT